jgi:hypothetical protein
VAPCAGRPAGKGRAPMKQKNAHLAFEGRNVEPGDGKGGSEGTRAGGRPARPQRCLRERCRWQNADSVVQYSLHQQYPNYGSSIWPHSECPFTSMGGASPTVAGKGGAANHSCGTWPSKVEALPARSRQQKTAPAWRSGASAVAFAPRHGLTTGCHSYVTVTSQLRHSYVTVTSQLRHEETYLILRIP